MDLTDVIYLIVVLIIVIPAIICLYVSMGKFKNDDKIYNDIKYKKKG